MTSAQGRKHSAAAAGAQISGDRAGRFQDDPHQPFPGVRDKQPLGWADDTDRPGHLPIPADDGRRHSRITDRGLGDIERYSG
jgi:hypothetical protein